MKSLAVVFAALAALVVAPSGSARAHEPAVEPWISFELAAIASNRLNPPRASRALALVSRAMFEASEGSGRERDAAVAAAASTVLAHLFPGQAEQARTLADPARRASRRGGFADGVAVAQRLIARAESDGSSAVWTGTPPTGSGFWVPTPPAFVFPPLEPLAGTWRTWNLRSGSQFRPAAPPAYGSARFLRELEEVYAVSRSLTAEQTAIASFWADGWSVRPVTAIRSLIDPSWSSLIATPPFPSYVSGHSTTSGAASTVLGRFFPAHARELARLADEAAISRLYGGIHFSSDNEAGLRLGRQIGAVASEAYLAEDD